MKLSLRSWGGFAGKTGAVTRTVDLDALPDDRRREGRALADAAHLFDRPARILMAAPQPWTFKYELEADDGPRVQRIELHLDAADDALRALVEWIEDQAPPVPSGVAPPPPGAGAP
jgi:hypothetical protein